MLLVVIGAGASYDSSLEVRPGSYHPGIATFRHEDYRPPLTDDLFAADRPYSERLRNHPRMQALVPELRQAIRDGTGLETALSRVAKRAEDDVETRRQLSAMRHYIADVINRCDGNWRNLNHGVTAYTALVEQVRRLAVDEDLPVTIVTFNYDRLLDSAARVSGLIETGDFDSHVDDRGIAETIGIGVGQTVRLRSRWPAVVGGPGSCGLCRPRPRRGLGRGW